MHSSHKVDRWLAKQTDSNLLLGTVLLDFSAAFDIIDHDLLLTKLAAYGFKLSAMKSYLSNRQQCVMLNGTFSSMKALHCSLPQGSCPLLYSIFVNDTPLILKNACSVVYTDDTTIYASAKNIIDLNSILQNELMQISKLVTEYKLKLNVSKTKCLVICSRNAQRERHRLFFSSWSRYWAGHGGQIAGGYNRLNTLLGYSH